MSTRLHKTIAKLIEKRHKNRNHQALLKDFFEYDNAAADLADDIIKLSGNSRGTFLLLEDLKDLHESLINLAIKLSKFGYKGVYDIYAEFDGDFQKGR